MRCLFLLPVRLNSFLWKGFTAANAKIAKIAKIAKQKLEKLEKLEKRVFEIFVFLAVKFLPVRKRSLVVRVRLKPGLPTTGIGAVGISNWQAARKWPPPLRRRP